MKKALSKTPWYLAFLAAYPALALLAANLREVRGDVIFRPLLASILFAALLFIMAWIICRERVRAALVTALFMSLFFLYGHVYEVVRYYGFLSYIRPVQRC